MAELCGRIGLNPRPTLAVYESNGPKNSDDLNQPGSRQWRETDFVYIVIKD
jgi:hypothetical protein